MRRFRITTKALRIVEGNGKRSFGALGQALFGGHKYRDLDLQVEFGQNADELVA